MKSNLKKILILIFILSMALGYYSVVYASSEVSQDVLTEYQIHLQNYEYVFLFETSHFYWLLSSNNSPFYLKFQGGSYYIYNNSNYNLCGYDKGDNLFYSKEFDLPATTSSIQNFIEPDSIKYSNFDIYLGDDVFFSQPKLPILTKTLQQTPKTLLTREVVGLTGPIGILMVGSVGLWKGLSLLRTHLRGA